MRLRYTVGEAGWADVVLECGASRAEMAASYLHDSLGDLIAGTNAVLGGAESVTILFMDEPGEHHLNVRRLDDERIFVQVIWYQDWRSWGIETGDGTLVLSCESTVGQLRGQVSSAASAILDDLGVEGYREKWGEHEFPIEHFQLLRAARVP